MDQSETPEGSGASLTPAVLRLKAMDILARREYSRQELADKLTTKLALGCDHQGTLAAVLDRLIDDDLLSDQRFAEALVRSRVYKGQGPRRILQTLHQRGVDPELATAALTDCGADWYALAAAVALKKYGGCAIADLQEKAKRSRFLQSRGFNIEHISYALSAEGVQRGESI